MTARIRFAYSAIVLTLLVFTGASLPGQGSDPSFIPIGLHPKQAYFGQLPFESIDMVNGNLILTFTDLVLPGDAGMDLVVQRTFNRQGTGWHFGLRGVPMEVTNPEAPWPQGDPDRIRPSLRTADGTDHPTTPYSSLSATDIWITDNFWRYTKDTRTVELPNGWTARYSSDTGRAMLEEVTDTYGNRITVDWEYPHEALRPRPTAFTQHLASGIRQIAFTYDNSSRLTPETMTFAGRTWTYAYGPDWPHLTSVTLPEGAPWQFDYSNGLLVTTPHGGTVRYQFEPQTFPDGAAWPLDVVRSRTTGGRAVEAGTWQFTYAPQTASQNGSFGTAAGPQGLSIEFRHDWAQFTSRWALSRKSIREPGQELAVLDRSYTNLSKVPWGSATIPVPHQDTITRDGVAHQITYDYRQNHEGEFFGDFHRPFRTTETGPLSRQTVVEYDYDFAFYVAGPLKRETVTVDGESFTSSFDHEDSTGFRTSQTIYGITTTFGRDGSGNPASATDANGHTTTTMYEWGVAKDTTTPEYGIARSINDDGTVASESRGDITRTFAYDGLGRPERVTESGADDTITSYAASEVTVSRGPTHSTTYLDGFGRPIGTSNSAGVVTETAYDALGNRRFQSYPADLGGPMIGDAFEYDLLGRVTRVTHADGSVLSYDYSGGDTHITDELGRTTIQRWRAFGDPDDARLMSVRDARGRDWSYTYNALGSLESVTAPDSTVRSWDYDHQNLLDSETHPESGTVEFEYDNVGNVIYKRDAEREISYTYDRNNRLEKISTPDGIDDADFDYDDLDNRTFIKNATVESRLHYRHGRLERREDVMAGRTFETTYHYDGRGNLRRVDYPSGRYVLYAIDNGDRVTEVRGTGEAGEQVFAGNINYHPSGAIESFTYGNGQQETLTLDGRQRPDLLASGPLNLDYDYDVVGNVKVITDARGSSRSSAFDYDDLDRLRIVTGFGARTFTYDDHGNRLTQQAGAVERGYTYVQNRLKSIQAATEFGGGEFEYDDVGNMWRDPAGRTYTYNAMNMMTSVTTTAGVSTYGYDGDNLRKYRSTDEGVFYYVHGLGGQLLAEYDASAGEPEVLREYVYLGTRLLASIGRGARPDPPISVRLSEPRNGHAFPNDETTRLTALPEITIPGDTIAMVEFYRDGILIDTDMTAPYAVDWTPNLPAGTYNLLARVVSAGGQSAISAPVKVELFLVGRVTGIIVSPESPAAGELATVTLTGNDNPCGGVIVWYGDGDLEAYLPPNGGPLSALTTSKTHRWLESGIKTLKATGQGELCRGTVTLDITVRGPQATLTSPAGGSTFIAPAAITLDASASDTSGQAIIRVDFYADGTLLGTDTSAPYSFVWSGASIGSHVLVAKAVNASNIVGVSAPVAIQVEPPPLIVSVIPGSPTATIPAQITIDGMAGCDTVNLTFGDGGEATFMGTSGQPLSGAYAWGTAGTRTVTAIGQGGTCPNRGSTSVTVQPPPPLSVTVLPESPMAGSAAQVTVTGPGPCTTVNVDFGDGTDPQTFTGDPGQPMTRSHTWATAGTRTLAAAGQGSACDIQVSRTITVQPPLAIGVSPDPPLVGQPATVTITGPAACTGVTVDFGDGTTQTLTSASGPPMAASHTWSSAGIRTVTVTGAGGVCPSPVSASVTIHPPLTITVSPASPTAGSAAQVTIGGPSACTTVNVDFGDGTSDTFMHASGPPITKTHMWTTAGTRTITATGQGSACLSQRSATVAVLARPAVSVTAPAGGATYTAPATINVTASATAGQGTLTQVDFYANGAWIGVDTSAPYAFSWSGVGTGSYALTARATDSFGAQATSSGVTVVVGQPPPSTVLGMTITPQPLGAGQTATITVTGTNPCTMLWMDFGDGHWWIAPITSLPFTTTHTWAAPGSYTVLARGYVSCGGEVTKAVTVGSAPMPDALDLAALRSVMTPLTADVEAEEPGRVSACRGRSCGFRRQADELSIRPEDDRWDESATHGPAVWLDDSVFDLQSDGMPALDSADMGAVGAALMPVNDVDAAPEVPFTAPATLHVTLMGSGSGSVSGPGLTCTGALGQTCSGTFQVGDVITLNATASTGAFAGWGGACSGAGTCTVTLSASTLVAATFNVPPPTVTQFYHPDVLGSVRAVTGTDGAVLRRHDYAAFGEELHTEEATPGLPYVAKQQRFTGKERDGESGLDYFAARYLAAGWGRFISADPGHVGGDIVDSQSWNAYAYARNNPLRFIDPTGTDYYVVVDGGQPFWVEGSESALHAFEAGGFSFKNGFIFNAAGLNVGSYQYFDPVARLAFEIGQRAAPGVNAALALGAAQVSIVAGAASLAGLGGPMATLGLQAQPILTNQLAGSIIGWGSGQAGAGLTRSLTNNLTKAAVEQMKHQGLNRATVENLLRQYERAIAQGGKKLANEQLLPRRELMKRILELW